MGRDGLLPGWFGRVSPRFATPANSIAFMGALIALLALSGSFVWLAVVSTLARMFVYSISIASLAKTDPSSRRSRDLGSRRLGGSPRGPGFRRGDGAARPGGWLMIVPAIAVCVWAGRPDGLAELADASHPRRGGNDPLSGRAAATGDERAAHRPRSRPWPSPSSSPAQSSGSPAPTRPSGGAGAAGCARRDCGDRAAGPAPSSPAAGRVCSCSASSGRASTSVDCSPLRSSCTRRCPPPPRPHRPSTCSSLFGCFRARRAPRPRSSLRE